MTVVEGMFHIMAAGGILFLLLSIYAYINSSMLVFSYGITIAIFLLFPECGMIIVNYLDNKDKKLQVNR